MAEGFPTTRWSRVLAARDGSDTVARQALETLCQTYWHPLYAFIRRQGYGPDDAGDLVQAYFAELLEKNFLGDVGARPRALPVVPPRVAEALPLARACARAR